MKIKIPPYPNFKITEQAFNRDVVLNSVEKNDSTGLSNQLVIIYEADSGEKRLLKTRPVRHDGNFFISAFPNPIHIFLSLSIEHYDHSENIKQINFIKCGEKIGDDVYLLAPEEDGTHACYNHYIKYRASSIIMLVSALEAFLNHIIPDNFIYKGLRKGKLIEFNKKDIESPKISFNEKLTEVIPQYLDNTEFWTNEKLVLQPILDLYSNRKNIIHLKTNSEDDLTRYFEAIDRMLDLNISESIEATVRFMNLVSENFVESSEE